MSKAAEPPPPTVAILSAGSMGARIGATLISNGVRVLTSVEGRSAATRERALGAGMHIVPPHLLGTADIVLSIVPSDQAIDAAMMLRKSGTFEHGRPLYVDCNPISPKTVDQLAQLLSATSCEFVDACILGAPPQHGVAPACRLIACGPFASRLTALDPYGLVTQVIDGPIGAASALRMCISGVSKGLTAILTVMIALSARAGVVEPLREELGRTHSALLAWISQQTARLPDTAERWSAEMHELAQSIPPNSGDRIVSEIADFYSILGTSPPHAAAITAALNDFFRRMSEPRSASPQPPLSP